MNWKRINKIYDQIEYFDQQIENLRELGTLINEDHENIYISIEHEYHGISQPQYPMPFMQVIDDNGLTRSRNKEPKFDPFLMRLKDEWAMDFIGQMITVLESQRDLLKGKLNQEKNTMYRVYVDGIGNVEETENNEIARKAFESFRDMSKEDFGNVGGKDVYLYKGNETLASHESQIKGDHHE